MLGKRLCSSNLDRLSTGNKRHKGGVHLGMQLSRLPEHILCFIFSLLHPFYLYQCSLVCRQWNSFITNDVDLKAVWAKQEPWLIVKCIKNEPYRYEVWCPLSDVRFPFPASLVQDIEKAGYYYQLGTCQGLTLLQLHDTLAVWSPLSGFTKLIPYPPIPYTKNYASDFWADVEQGVYKIGHHCPTGVHVYDSAVGSWVFEETGCEIRELGKLVTIPNASAHNPFSPPTSYVKQYASDAIFDMGKWKQWSGSESLHKFYTLFRDGKGRCNGVHFETKHPPFCLSLWRFVEGPTWVPLGKISIYKDVDLCGSSEQPKVHISCSGDYIVVSIGVPYPSRVMLFNIETLRWDVLQSGINDEDESLSVLAMFHPNLLSPRARPA